ncbi:hypothetical protein LPJ70_007791, partial [Coemansia sp. RSA 2708]
HAGHCVAGGAAAGVAVGDDAVYACSGDGGAPAGYAADPSAAALHGSVPEAVEHNQDGHAGHIHL